MGNPFTVPIGTSDPMDLSKGLALIPSLGTLRAGISASSRCSIASMARTRSPQWPAA